MKTSKNYRLKNPPHPGGVKTEIIEPLKLSVTEAARALGVTRPALSALLNERASLSPEMALRIEKAFGVGMDTSCECRIATILPRLDKGKARSRSNASPASEV